MSCNCKTKKKKTTEPNTKSNNIQKTSVREHFIKISRIILIGIVLIFGLPAIWILLMFIVIKSYYGEPVDLAKTFKKIIKKDTKAEVQEEINSDDLELVGVDTIK